MQALPSSYRDTNGYVFEQDGKIYRYIDPRYESHYAELMRSGLYMQLITECLLVPHEEIAHLPGTDFPKGRVILPMQIPFISHPYEWSFDMWKDAALLTLQIAGTALKKGMILKDATPFNVQFCKGKPVFIDTLSFEIYEEEKPWIAYRQFCECFLAPMLLMHYCHPDTNRIFTVYPNGIPLDVLKSLLPARSKLNLNTYLHIHLQSNISGTGKGKQNGGNDFSKHKLETILRGLTSFVNDLRMKKNKAGWTDYYTDTILGEEYLKEKGRMVQSFLQNTAYKTVVDLGSNDGHFSFLIATPQKEIIAVDGDAGCINTLYDRIKSRKINNIHPLLINFFAPSPAIGWNNRERNSLAERLKGDLVMALALVHHLAIAGNVPLSMIAQWLIPMGKYLVIEFVPKEDEKVKLLLQNRKDIFYNYSLPEFKKAFGEHYEIIREETVGDTNRSLFLMKLK